MELFVFIAAAAMVLAGAFGVILRPNPVHAALSLVLTLFGIAVLFVAQEAHFLAVVQVIVYAGAIVVLFLFVIMLLGVDRTDDLRVEPFRVQRPVAIVIGVAIVGLVSAAVLSGAGDPSQTITGEQSVGGTLTSSEPNINTAGAIAVLRLRLRVRGHVHPARGGRPGHRGPRPAARSRSSPAPRRSPRTTSEHEVPSR